MGNRHSDLCCIIYCVCSFTLVTVKHRNNPGCVVDHPFISDLKAGTTVSIAYIFYKVRYRQYGFILFLALPVPACFKPIIGAGTHQLHRVTLITKAQYDLCSPDINTSCHAGNKDIQSVSNRLTDFFF